MTSFKQFGKMQYFDWGTLLWFFEPNNPDVERLSVGLITFKPYSVHEEHLHSGDEQVFNVISGRGMHAINGRPEDLNPGDVKHIPPYARHKVVNSSPEELKILIIYTPSKFQQLLAQPSAPYFGSDSNILAILDKEVLSQLLKKLSGAINLSLAVLGKNGEFLTATDNYPTFCTLLAGASKGKHCQTCVLGAFRNAALLNKPYFFLCCYDIASIIMPIFNGNAIIGYIKCGQIFLTKPEAAKISDEFDVLCKSYGIEKQDLLREYLRVKQEPKSRLYAAAEATFTIAGYITDMAVTTLQQKELDKNRISLMQEQIAKEELSKALRESDIKLLQSRINPHFLFNTLNTIAQMAYLDGSDKVAGLVWNLSELLRSSFHKIDRLIPLKEEIKILRSYVDIQLSRFGERLTIDLDTDSQLDDVHLPCMLLQPLVENAVIHGFERSRKKGAVKVSVWQSGISVVIAVNDNGLGFDPISFASAKGNGLGIQSVKNRLQYYFGDNYTFQIDSKPEKGTRVLLSFPKIEGGCHEKY